MTRVEFAERLGKIEDSLTEATVQIGDMERAESELERLEGVNRLVVNVRTALRRARTLARLLYVEPKEPK